MPRAYISAKIKDELRIRQIRDQIWSITDAHRFYKKVTPHITVIPPFTVKEGHEEEVQKLIKKWSLKDRQVEIKMLGVYENIHQPYVVLLCVDVNIEDVRKDLLDDLEEHKDGKIVDPVRPHITLFKTQGWWDDVDDELKNTLQHEIQHRTSMQDTQITSLEVDFKA